jgi:hypothetical protein
MDQAAPASDVQRASAAWWSPESEAALNLRRSREKPIKRHDARATRASLDAAHLVAAGGLGPDAMAVVPTPTSQTA